MMDLDSMLKDLGQFGKYQAFCFTVLMFPVIMCGFRSTEYIFTTMSIPHRCLVPECEDSPKTADFKAPWLHAAVPFTDRANNHIPHECLRYQPLSAAAVNNQTVCSADIFNKSATVSCDDWVFSEPTKTIGTDFKILCPGDLWKLTLISSVFVLPSFIGIPVAGLISDRVGRKTVLVCSCVFLAVTGIIRSFSVNYTMSLIMESLDGFMAGAVYSPAFILGLEILAPQKRLLGSLLINVYFALGEVVLALVMWATADWRLMLRVLYIPSLLLVLMHWLLPESVRWLHTQDRIEDIEKIFSRMAKMNNTEDKLPSVLSQLRNAHTQDKSLKPPEQSEKAPKASRLTTVLKSRIIMGRFIALAFCWMASIFSYYGISQYTTLFESSNRYVSFLLVSLIEVPAYVASLWLPDWPLLGRQGTTAWSFFLCGVTCFLLMFVSKGQVVLSLFLFLTSKFASTLTLTVLYVYTAELFPTELRHTLLAFCSMVGRVGSVLSQQTPLISSYFDPMILFSLISILGGIFTLTCPETLNTTLPDTIEEAEKIGQPQQKQGQTVPPEAQKY
ncbi:solute carrier family 22 member 4-like [Macrosteles quadrilineatus]|uniref:solute carrier family 22 member 4-like n=1 Tax=Macrosteles quadrilineatus TaxID=74068 RepID=UPI0023E14AE6|nr:solute carrier family 22 member 4-like [Macrosteles quadrilineatus]XP_054273465.1 solute carrier family 22 member 4-like [Macrosteles quadrilineatus]